MTEPSTPLMRQYAAIKKEHPNALLFFRLGDFYELFFDDAVVAAKELQITLTSRNKEKGIAVPMCGVPYHAAEGYIAKLIRKGFKVAICEQMEDPRLAKKLVRREVTRVVTPGTAADSSLSSEENNFLARGRRSPVIGLDSRLWIFRPASSARPNFMGPDAARRIQEELQQLRPKELLYASSAPLFESAAGSGIAAGRPSNGSSALPSLTRGYAETPLDDWIFAPDHAIPAARKSFWRAFAGGIRTGRQASGCVGSGSDPALRALHPARNLEPCGPHRILRAAELPGARRGDGTQSGADRAAVRGHRRGRHAVSRDGCDRHAHGQAPAARVDAASVD